MIEGDDQSFEQITDGILNSGGNGDLEDEDGRDGSDGIDDDAFPFYNGSDLAGGLDETKKGTDHGRTSHNQNGSKEGGHPPVPVENILRRNTSQDSCD